MQNSIKLLGESMAFILVIIIVFNMLTEFAEKVGIISSALSGVQLQIFGMLASIIAGMNAVSDKFFGFRLVR